MRKKLKKLTFGWWTILVKQLFEIGKSNLRTLQRNLFQLAIIYTGFAIHTITTKGLETLLDYTLTIVYYFLYMCGFKFTSKSV